MMITYVKTYSPPEIDTRQILRYSGQAGENIDTTNLINESLLELDSKLIYKVCYREFKIKEQKDFVDLGFTKTSSQALRKNLENCDSIILFAATIGFGLDRLISKYSRIQPSKALIMQAIGAERIESLADAFCRDMQEIKTKDNKYLRPRFSPGYGDFDICVQKDIFKALNYSVKIGLKLNESMSMSPSKSVTAIIGVSSKECNNKHNCSLCDKIDCQYRR